MARFESHKHDQELKEALIELGELPDGGDHMPGAALKVPAPAGLD